MSKSLKLAAMLLAVVAVVATGCHKGNNGDDNGGGNGGNNGGGSNPTTGTINGHTWVDLGLPSGTLWANTNVGADTPEAYGGYFAWGETETKSTYYWNTYKYANGDYDKLTKYCNDASYGDDGFTDTLTVLLPEDDAATANWGGVWRMPTANEMHELLENCTHNWTTQNGVNGYLFTATNGNSIFLPAAGGHWDGNRTGSYGDYWFSSLGTSSPEGAWNLHFDSYDCVTGNSGRCSGFSVRPVCSSQN